MVVHDLDVRPDVKAAGLDAPDILRQPAHAVAVRSLQIGLGHQACYGRGILLGQTDLVQRFLDKGPQPVERNYLGQDRHSLAARGV